MREPAQTKSTWTYKSHFVWKFTGKNAHGDVTKAILCGNLQGKMPHTTLSTSIKHQAFYSYRKTPFSVATLFRILTTLALSFDLTICSYFMCIYIYTYVYIQFLVLFYLHLVCLFTNMPSLFQHVPFSSGPGLESGRHPAICAQAPGQIHRLGGPGV